MDTIIRPYNLESIKYFRPDGAIMTVKCPHCHLAHNIDVGDDFIEYPKPSQVIDHITCDCGRNIRVRVNIKMTVVIDYQVEVGMLEKE